MPRLDNLDELRAFAQVVESGSIVKAATVLATHPSTVTRRLLALEERIGRPLLNRSTRRQSLSETGRALLGQVHRILLETETAELLLDEDATGLSGLVKIGVVSVLHGRPVAVRRPRRLSSAALSARLRRPPRCSPTRLTISSEVCRRGRSTVASVTAPVSHRIWIRAPRRGGAGALRPWPHRCRCVPPRRPDGGCGIRR